MAHPAVPPDFLLGTKTNTKLFHIRSIDAGGGGEVHQVSDPESGKVFARKIIRLGGRVREDDVKNEMRAVAKLCMTQNTHKNIVSVFDYGPISTFLYFIDMELCDLNLEHWIHRTWDEATAEKLPFLTAELPPRARVGQVWDIMEDITRAVAFIHESHEIHRDLKPSNVLYSLANEAWKVTDFGFTMEGSSRRAHTTVNSRGTPSYLAPELISEAEPRYTNKVDMWGVGCILYELVLRRKAFGNDFETLRYADSGKRYDIIIEPEILPDDRRREFISKIIKELLSIDPSQRPRADLLYKRFISWGSDISVHPPDPTNPFPSHILLPSDVAHTDSSTTIIDHSPLPVNHSIPTTATQGSEHSQLALANASDYSAVTSSDTHPAPKSADHAEIEPYNAELYLAGKNDHAAQESQSVQHLTNPEGHDRRVNIITSALQHPNGNKGQQSSVASKASVAIQRLVVGKNAPIDAAGDGDIEKVKKLLGLNVSTKTRNKNGQTALHLAAEKGRRDRVALLLGKMDRADVAAKDRWQNTALHRAAGNGHRDVVALLLGRMDPDDVATKDEWQQTALHWAAKEGHRDVVALLLGHMDGADVATKDDLGSTALDRAAMNGHKDVVALLLNSFAATSAKDVSLKTALDWAAKQRHRDVVTLLEKWERDHQDH